MHFGRFLGGGAPGASLQSMTTPQLKDLLVQLETLVRQGQLSPEQYQVFLQQLLPDNNSLNVNARRRALQQMIAQYTGNK